MLDESWRKARGCPRPPSQRATAACLCGHTQVPSAAALTPDLSSQTHIRPVWQA